MLRRRAPWVAIAAGGPVLGYFLLLVYCDIRRPETPGLVVEAVRGALVVRAVEPGSPGARAGLQPGDRILGWATWRIADVDWMFIDAHVALDRPMRLDVARAGTPLAIDLT